MNRIILPDRICSHCGGNEWLICTNGGGYIYYFCRKKKNEQRHTHYLKHRDRISKDRKIRWPYNKVDKNKRRETEKRRRQRERDELHDRYIKNLLSLDKSLKWAEITTELINLQRQKLKLKRHVKEINLLNATNSY